MTYHQPVLRDETVSALVHNPAGTYLDLTFGGGGHSRAILNLLAGGQLLAFDQDPDAAANAEGLDAVGSDLTFVAANFRHVARYLRLYGIKTVDGILADLGVSSHQFDVPDRGFSTRFEAELDMRMNPAASRTAQQVLNTYSEAELHRILGMYGEVRNARTLAQALVSARVAQPLRTVEDLKKVLSRLAPRGRTSKYYAQVFQALRIEVNEELEALREMLLVAPTLLKPGGRLAVISYHSLEDRLVKNLIQTGNLTGTVEQDFYGNVIKPLEAINRKPITPSPEELEQNPRARSAKLRIAEKSPQSIVDSPQ
ncbi:MAG: 16S rRNA (cytosine(1402)-N(4))-methyltransferase RsmH [Tunicatimonas sp.]